MSGAHGYPYRKEVSTPFKLLACWLLVVALSFGLARCAHAEPIHFQTPVRVTTAGGSTEDLPPGYYMTEAEWSALEVRLRGAEDGVTRLTAENASLRESAESRPWDLLRGAAVVFVIGVVLGAGAALYLEHR